MEVLLKTATVTTMKKTMMIMLLGSYCLSTCIQQTRYSIEDVTDTAFSFNDFASIMIVVILLA